MSEIREGGRLVSKKTLPDLPEEWLGSSFIEIIFNLCQEALEKNPEQEWLEDAQNGQVLLLKEMKSRCMKAAKVLVSYGVKEGTVVHVVMPNCIEFHVTVFAIWMVGGIASLADPSLRTSILLEQIKETKSELVICHPDVDHHDLKKTRQMIVTSETLFEGVSDEKNNFIEPDFSVAKRVMNETLVIFWSSGTTGRPKGIAHGINFFLRSLVKSAFTPATLLQTVKSKGSDHQDSTNYSPGADVKRIVRF